MEELNAGLIKNWREKLDLSQKRLAELAKISLTTLRQFEFGTHKPQRKTLRKLIEVMQGVQSGALTREELHPPRRRRGGAAPKAAAPVVSKPAAPAPAPLAAKPAAVKPAEAVAPRKRGRPRKNPLPISPIAAPLKTSAVKTAPAAPAAAKVAAAPATGKKRGRKPKIAAPATAPISTPAPTPSREAAPSAKSVPAPAPVIQPARPGMAAIQLSNLDLELINRVLNMTGREKLALLEKLM